MLGYPREVDIVITKKNEKKFNGRKIRRFFSSVT